LRVNDKNLSLVERVYFSAISPPHGRSGKHGTARLPHEAGKTLGQTQTSHLNDLLPWYCRIRVERLLPVRGPQRLGMFALVAF
jgi:hypothetical protein